MATEKVKKLTVKQLKKRKKAGSVLLLILTIAIVLSVVGVLYRLVIGDGLNTPLFVSAIACFTVSIPVYLGKKKIDLELKNKGID